MANPAAEGKKKQVILCASEAQEARARELFPKLQVRYLNGEGFESLAGERVVCFGRDIARRAARYAAEVRMGPDEIPDDLTLAKVRAWAEANFVTYALESDTARQVAASDSFPEKAADNGMAEVVSPPPRAPLPPPAEAVPQSLADTEAMLDAILGPVDDAAAPEAPPPFPDDEERSPERSSVFVREHTDQGNAADLWGHEDSLPVMPHEVYPEAIADYVSDEADIMGCDPGMLALYCIAICAGCLTDEIKVQVKSASERWQEPARVWLMIVGDSGLTMKSPSLDAAISHAWKLEREMRLKGAEALKAYEMEREIYESQRAEYVKKRAKGDPQEAPIEPAIPVIERLIVGNATLEAISEVLLLQGERGVLVRADELLGIIAGMNQYKGGKGSDRTEWLEMWNGGPHPIDRKGRAVLIKNWGASIVGGTQPEAIARIGHSLQVDGLLQRFTVYQPRYSTKGTDRRGSAEARARYYNVLDRLTKMVVTPTLEPVQFDEDAKALMSEARDWIMAETRKHWMPANMRSHLAKWPAMLARFCLTYAAIEAADENHAAMPKAISVRIVEQVWKMMKGTLWPHVDSFYLNVLSRGLGNISAVRQIAGYILANSFKTITTRQIQQRCTLYRVAHPLVRKEILNTLCELGWIWPNGGKSQLTGLPTLYKVNEEVHGRYAHVAQDERERRAENDPKKKGVREPGED